MDFSGFSTHLCGNTNDCRKRYEVLVDLLHAEIVDQADAREHFRIYAHNVLDSYSASFGYGDFNNVWHHADFCA